MNIYLASTSPRRRDLLRRLGLRFQVMPPMTSEEPDAVGLKAGADRPRACHRRGHGGRLRQTNTGQAA